MPYRSYPAIDKRQFYRERPWAFWFGVVLAVSAGYVNVVALGFFKLPVSHVTGSVSHVSIDIVDNQGRDLALALSAIGGFWLGAVLSGAIIGNSSLLPGRRYGVALMLVGTMLAAATWCFISGSALGIGLAALACGLQNGMYSSYHGLILRTTHLTGVVTDLGVLVGHWLRHRQIEWWKVTLLSGILAAFLLGGIVGALALRWLGARAMGAAAAWSALAGLAYFIYKQRHPSMPPAALQQPQEEFL